MILKKLDNGLVLRHPTKEDTNALAALVALAFDGDQENVEHIRRVMRNEEPGGMPENVTVVEDTNTGALVSMISMRSLIWSYANVEFPVGEIALVCTHPDYRRRGLVRSQFEFIHKRSNQLGHKMQAVSGFDFYRQFGYNPTMWAYRQRYWDKDDRLWLDDEDDGFYHMRPAENADVPFIIELYKQETKRNLVNRERYDEAWCLQLFHMSEKYVSIIETTNGQPLGFLVFGIYGWLYPKSYELKSGALWQDVTPSVIRYLWELDREFLAQKQVDDNPGIDLMLGTAHPLWQFIDGRPDTSPWYVRFPDVSRFLHHISGVLEQRLMKSALAGYTGELRINLYGNGLQLGFSMGDLNTVESWVPTHTDEGDAAFRNDMFTQLVLGSRSFVELEQSSEDCWVHDEVRELLRILFPEQQSWF